MIRLLFSITLIICTLAVGSTERMTALSISRVSIRTPKRPGCVKATAHLINNLTSKCNSSSLGMITMPIINNNNMAPRMVSKMPTVVNTMIKTMVSNNQLLHLVVVVEVVPMVGHSSVPLNWLR